MVIGKKGVESVEEETAGVMAYGRLCLPGHEKRTI
jgi:hypothetical protein